MNKELREEIEGLFKETSMTNQTSLILSKFDQILALLKPGKSGLD
jgi:hypothetical protein